MSSESTRTKLKTSADSDGEPPEKPPGEDGEGPEDDGGLSEINYIEARDVTVARLPGGTYRATIAADRSLLRAEFSRAFPLSDPEQYIEIVDGTGGSAGMMRSLRGMDSESAKCVAESLEQKYFVPAIQQIYEVREEWGNQFWSARTDRGDVEFFVKDPRKNVRVLPPSRVLITDVDNNRFEVLDLRQLDEESFQIIDRVI